MKNIYFKIAIGIISFGLFFIIDSTFLTETNSILWYLLCFLLPVIIFNKKLLTSWFVLYILYILSNVYIKIIPYHINPYKVCGLDILCGDERFLNYFLIYFFAVVVLCLIQLKIFIQRKFLDKPQKN